MNGNYMNTSALAAESFSGIRYVSVTVASFGANFIRLQARAKLSGTAAAKAIGVVKSQVTAWRKDTKGLPETPNLLRIAKGLQCTVDELLDGLDPEYDAVRDLIRQESGADSPTSEGSPNGSATTRLLELAAAVSDEEAALRQVLSLAQDLVELATSRAESLAAAREKATRRRHR